MPNTKNDLDKFDELNIQALLLAKVVERILKIKANIQLSSRPVLQKKPIVEFMKRMRVGQGIEKFRVAAYISLVNFYKSEADMKEGKTLGAIVLYIDEDYISELFQKMGYPRLDEDQHEELEDASGTLCNLIGAKFKAGLTQLGYQDVFMSHFLSFRNEVLNGIEFDPSQKEKYEISFEIEGEKRLIAELTLGAVPESDQL